MPSAQHDTLNMSNATNSITDHVAKTGGLNRFILEAVSLTPFINLKSVTFFQHMRVFLKISNRWVVCVIVEQKRVEAQTSQPSKHCSPKEESIVPMESHEVKSGLPSKSTISTHLILTQHLLCVFIERNDKHKGKADTLMNSLQVE